MINYSIKEIISLSPQLKQAVSLEEAEKLTALFDALAAWQDYSLADLEQAKKPKKSPDANSNPPLASALAALADLGSDKRESAWQALIQDTKFTAEDWKNAAKAICKLSRKPSSKTAAVASLSQQYAVSPGVAFDLGGSAKNEDANVQALVSEIEQIEKLEMVVDVEAAFDALVASKGKKYKAEDWKKAAFIVFRIKAKSGVDAKNQLKQKLKHQAAHITANWGFSAQK